MAIAFDQSPTPFEGTASNTVAGTWTDNAANGATVIVGIACESPGALTAAPTYGGNAMTLVGEQNDAASSFAGTTAMYYYNKTSSGSATISFKPASSMFCVAGSVSYTGVGVVGAAIFNNGTSNTPSSGALTVAAGQWAVGVLGEGSAGAFTIKTTSPSGGTNRQCVDQNTAQVGGLVISDATANVTFTAFNNQPSQQWGAVSTILSPPTVAALSATGQLKATALPLANANLSAAGLLQPQAGAAGVPLPPLVAPNPMVGPQAMRQRMSARIPYVATQLAGAYATLSASGQLTATVQPAIKGRLSAHGSLVSNASQPAQAGPPPVPGAIPSQQAAPGHRIGPVFSKSITDLFTPIGTNGCPDPTINPMGALQYLQNRRSVIQGCANQKPQIRIADKNLNILTDLTDEISCEVEEMMADSGVLKAVIKYSHWLEDFLINGLTINEDLHILVDPIPTHPSVQGIPQDWQVRWGGKCKEISVEHNGKGESTITFSALSHREHTKHLLFGANPFFPPELQLPKMWVLPGPLRSIAFASGFVNLARLFVPGLSFITNAFNPASWLNPLNPDALLNFNPLSWPIQVAFVDPALDTSMWSVLAATWTDWHNTLNDLLYNAGCVMRAYTWLTTDATSPHTELTSLISAVTEIGVDLLSLLGLSSQSQLVQVLEGVGGVVENLTRPTRNCVIISFEDKSGITGPTGTALDGLLELVGITLDDLITSVVFDQSTGQTVNGEPVINPNDVSPLFQTLLGVRATPPKVVYRDGQFTGMVERKVNMHKGPPLTMMTGGRSPTLVNELQTFGIKYALSELSDVITLNIAESLPGPTNFSQQVPGTPGLDAIYQGQLDNCLLAWERYTDPLRALWTGELAYQEYIERGSSSAYTLAGFLNLAEGHWKTRAFYGFETKTLNGRPWVYGLDFRLADQLGFEMDGVIYVDQLAAAKFKYDRKQPIFLEMSIGDDKDKHDPVMQGLRILQGIYGLVGAYLGEGTIFG